MTFCRIGAPSSAPRVFRPGCSLIRSTASPLAPAAGGLNMGGWFVGIEARALYSQSRPPFGGARAVAAEADDHPRLAVEIEGELAEPVAPGPVLDDAMHLRGALGERQHHEQRLFG